MDEGVHPRLGTSLMCEWNGNYEREREVRSETLVIAATLKGDKTGLNALIHNTLLSGRLLPTYTFTYSAFSASSLWVLFVLCSLTPFFQYFFGFLSLRTLHGIYCSFLCTESCGKFLFFHKSLLECIHQRFH